MIPAEAPRRGSIEMAGCVCRCGGTMVWHRGQPVCNRCGTFVSQDTEYCGVPLKGGWCKRPQGHGGEHACS
jgi:hypothetical protein